MICAAVTYVIKPGHGDEAAELFRTLTEHTPPSLAAGCTWRIGRRPIPAGSFSMSNTPIRPLSMLTARHRTSSDTSRRASFPSPRAAPELFEPLTD